MNKQSAALTTASSQSTSLVRGGAAPSFIVQMGVMVGGRLWTVGGYTEGSDEYLQKCMPAIEFIDERSLALKRLRELTLEDVI